MQRRIINILFVLAGTTLGISLLPYAWQALQQEKNMMLNNNVTNGLIGAIVFFILIIIISRQHCNRN